MGVFNPATTLFDSVDRIELIDKLGVPLQEINKAINWEPFTDLLVKHFPIKKKSKGGRPRMLPLKMFKILLLQKMYDLSDQATEYHIADRMSFQRFLNIPNTKSIPDEKTIWLFKEQLKEKELVYDLFNLFKEALKNRGLIVNDGKIIDASIVHAPK